MFKPPQIFDVFGDPTSQSSMMGNPAVLYEVIQPGVANALTDATDTLVDQAVQHPGTDVCFYQLTKEGVMVRWFNGQNEIQFCGHASLALAWWLHHSRGLEPIIKSSFHTIKVVRLDDQVWIKVPRLASFAHVPQSLPLESLDLALRDSSFEPVTKTLLVELASESEVGHWQPDFSVLESWGRDTIGALIVYSRSCRSADGCFRYFAPWYGKAEDHATGSALRMLQPLIEPKDSDRSTFVFRQLSANGAHLLAARCDSQTVLISGHVRVR